MGMDAMTIASMAEALFNPFKGGERPNPRQLSDRIKGWSKKLVQEAGTEAEVLEKFTVAFLRSTLNQELKDYLDLTKTSTIQRYLVKIEEWVQCKSMG